MLLYYTGCRVSEIIRTTREAFTVTDQVVYWEVGKRLKHGKHTPPLPLSRDQPHMELLLAQITATKKNSKVFNFDRTTAWRHTSTTGFGYNHHARLSAITFFLRQGYSVAQIVNFFGISVQTVNSYIGVVDLAEMGAIKR